MSGKKKGSNEVVKPNLVLDQGVGLRSPVRFTSRGVPIRHDPRAVSLHVRWIAERNSSCGEVGGFGEG